MKGTCFPALFFGMLLATSHAQVITLAHPDQPIPDNCTVIWSSLFQAAWDQFNTRFAAPLDRVEPPNEIMAKLDPFKWEAAKVMPEGSWKTWSGPANAGFLQKVKKQAFAMTKKAGK